MITYTVWCRDRDGSMGGTVWIDTIQREQRVNFKDEDEVIDARRDAEGACADAWECSADDVECFGMAEGNIEINFWED